jgi:hypothetical protein
MLTERVRISLPCPGLGFLTALRLQCGSWPVLAGLSGCFPAVRARHYITHFSPLCRESSHITSFFCCQSFVSSRPRDLPTSSHGYRVPGPPCDRMGAHDADVVAAGQSGLECLDLADKLIFIDVGRLLACDNRLGRCIYPIPGWPTVVPLLAGKHIYSGHAQAQCRRGR